MKNIFLSLILGCLVAGSFIDANAMQAKLTTLKNSLQNLGTKLGALKNSLGELKRKLGTPSGGGVDASLFVNLMDPTKFEAAKTALINAARTDVEKVIEESFTPSFEGGRGFAQAIKFASMPELWNSDSGFAKGNILFMELAIYGQGIEQAIQFVDTRIEQNADKKEAAEYWGWKLLEGLAAIADSVDKLEKINVALGKISDPDAGQIKLNVESAIHSINRARAFEAIDNGLALVIVAEGAFKDLISGHRVGEAGDRFSRITSVYGVGLQSEAVRDFLYVPQIVRCILKKVLKLGEQQIAEIDRPIATLCDFLVKQDSGLKEAADALLLVFRANKDVRVNHNRIKILGIFEKLVDKNYPPAQAIDIAKQAVVYTDPAGSSISGTGSARDRDVQDQGVKLFKKLKKKFPDETKAAINELLASATAMPKKSELDALLTD